MQLGGHNYSKSWPSAMSATRALCVTVRSSVRPPVWPPVYLPTYLANRWAAGGKLFRELRFSTSLYTALVRARGLGLNCDGRYCPK